MRANNLAEIVLASYELAESFLQRPPALTLGASQPLHLTTLGQMRAAPLTLAARQGLRAGRRRAQVVAARRARVDGGARHQPRARHEAGRGPGGAHAAGGRGADQHQHAAPRPAPVTINPLALNPKPETRNPKPETQNLKPET